MKREELVSRLARLTDAHGPSGYEGPATEAWAELAFESGLTAYKGPAGNVMATTGDVPEDRRPRLLMSGHIDEVGLQVRHIDPESGCLYFHTIGGWDPAVLLGQRIQIRTRTGFTPGVVARKATHEMSDDEQETITLDDLWIDIGAGSEAEAKKLVRIGDAAVIDANLVRFGKNIAVSKALDNRVGAFAVLQAMANAVKDIVPGSVVALANTREEILSHGSGANIGGMQLRPERAVVVDLGMASDHPACEPYKFGEREMGSGVMISRGGVMDPDFFDEVEQMAIDLKIKYTIDAIPGSSYTDADTIATSGASVLLLSVPSRYMHSPVEMVDLRDVEALVALLTEIARRHGEFQGAR